MSWWFLCSPPSSAVQTASWSEFASGADKNYPGDAGHKMKEILALLFCHPLRCKVTTLSSLMSGYRDQQRNMRLLSPSPVTLFHLGSGPTSDHKNGLPCLDNPESGR